MLIKRPRPRDVTENDVTDARLYRRRREFMARVGVAAGGLALGLGGTTNSAGASVGARISVGTVELGPAGPSAFSTSEELTDEDTATSYNNFYEFGTGKRDPVRRADRMTVSPWSVRVSGECAKPGDYAVEDVLRGLPIEERIYRLRCVEAWSMVIPWLGVPMATLLDRFEPLGSAKFVEFRTLYDPEQMPGQRRPVLDWPYREGLRMDEARHPLTIMGVGMYGDELPNQNGAPLRLVVPWKYGFKSIKSIVEIRFRETMPATSWNMSAPQEYGFYANVNPRVDHPRWSQARERRIGDVFRRRTLMFNGYGDEVASLYSGMDLRKYY